MADRGDTHYRVPTLNLWFAVSSLALLATAFWMVIDDWDRSWKGYQREFRSIEIERNRAALETPEAQAALAEEARLGEVLAQVEGDLERQQADIDAKEEELFQAEGLQFKHTEAEKSAKQEYNWERYLYEMGKSTEDTLNRMALALEEAAAQKEATDLDVAVVADELAALTAQRDEVIQQQKDAAKSIDLVRKRLARIDPEDFPTRLANLIRDFPGLDFIGPDIKVRKQVLADLTFELNFTKKPRIDMCQTCHMAVDLPDFEGDLEHPFRSHPRLDLFLSAKSPHPLTEVGCTICHRGSGESLHFVRADHRPSDEEEAHAWEEEYHWHKQHHWDYPMLSSEYVEAGCIQCHTDSMELIADEAPRMTEGYRLFERYGCYACHKVEWFPTKRRPGPSLKHVAEKVTPEFMASWVADPRGFRPSTWMPQIFHLENWPADETVVVSDYGAGEPILGQDWNDTAIAAVTAFVMDASTPAELPPIPVEGDVAQGRELFRLTGCLACHNMAPYGEEDTSGDLALHNRGTNEHGPNLRGINTKTSPEWLYRWIKDPATYWPDTRMPDLRLTDQEAADIVAYIFEDPEGIFGEVPEEWSESAPVAQREVLEEQARWYFGNMTRPDFDKAFGGEWAEDRDLMVAVGEKIVMAYGCQSCHDIAGMEDAMPIGTELTTWGSKTVDKLDWGFFAKNLAAHEGWSEHRREEFKMYRENWITQKLHAPRSFDQGYEKAEQEQKVKTPTEKLKMPWFDFEPEEIQAISTFVVGLVKDEVQRARMVPTAGQASMDAGLRAIRQKNCASCHMIEPGTITFADEDGDWHTVSGQLAELAQAPDTYFYPSEGSIFHDTRPPLGDGLHGFLDDFEQAMMVLNEEDEVEPLEELIIELERPAPGLGNVGDTLLVEGADRVDSVRSTPPWGGDFVPLVTSYYRAPWEWNGEDEFSLTADEEGGVTDVDGTARYYGEEPLSKIRWAYAPPLLVDEGAKVQRDWFYQFLLEPYPLRQQMRVRMPTFTWNEGEAGAVADYFAQQAARSWPTRYTSRLLTETGLSADELAAQMLEQGITGASAEEIENIVQGSQPDIAAGMHKVLQYELPEGVEIHMAPPNDPVDDAVVPRIPSVLNGTLERHPDFFESIGTLVGPSGPNCFSCHFMEGVAPSNVDEPTTWGPDLVHARERLRADWVREWLTNPLLIYPGTPMPSNFSLDQTQYQELWPKPSIEQIEDVLIWLFNLDRDPTR